MSLFSTKKTQSTVFCHHNTPSLKETPPADRPHVCRSQESHNQPLAAKIALQINEHNNGHMAIGKYVVWMSEVNVNDKPDLNGAFSSSMNAAQRTRWRAQADASWGRTSTQSLCPVLCIWLAYMDAADILGSLGQCALWRLICLWTNRNFNSLTR